MKTILTAAVLLFLLIVPTTTTCRGQEVVVLHSKSGDLVEGPQLLHLAGFLGLTVRELEPADVSRYVSERRWSSKKARRRIIAIAVFANSLGALDPALRRQLRGDDKHQIPTLVYGISDQTNAAALSRWSHGFITGCRRLGTSEVAEKLEFGKDAEVDRELAGVSIPALTTATCSLTDSSPVGNQTVWETLSGGRSASLLSKISTAYGAVFFGPEKTATGGNSGSKSADMLIQFVSTAAPSLIFLKYAAKEFAWHIDGQYANLTIDDPWLVEPYGNLHYGALLDEMKQHKFHTTIAFVPWNFERNKKDVVDIFKKNPQYYSVCVHGNNHVHREFDLYPDTPLGQQVQDLRQSVLRMEAMQHETGLRYDRFMVFPHGVAPEETFRALRRNGFLGTANAVNVPLDQPAPTDPLFWMKTYSSAYGDILSLSRYSFEAPLSKALVPIQLYLGNPILFYGHQQMFHDGSGTFNSMADLINLTHSNTRWVSLGEVSRHLYEVREQGNGTADVRMFTNNISFTASLGTKTVYSFTYRGAPSDIVSGVESDGLSVNWRHSADGIVFHLQPNDVRSHDVKVIFDVSPDSPIQSAASRDFNIGVLRRLSDFRDMHLSRYSWGRRLVDLYYDHGGNSIERAAERWWFAAAALLLTGAGLGLVVASKQRRRGLRPARGN